MHPIPESQAVSLHPTPSFVHFCFQASSAALVVPALQYLGMEHSMVQPAQPIAPNVFLLCRLLQVLDWKRAGGRGTGG